MNKNGDVCDISKIRGCFKGIFDYRQHQEWKILDIMVHREPNHYINHFDRSKWPRDFFISISQDEDDPNKVAHLAAIFSAIDLSKDIHRRALLQRDF